MNKKEKSISNKKEKPIQSKLLVELDKNFFDSLVDIWKFEDPSTIDDKVIKQVETDLELELVEQVKDIDISLLSCKLCKISSFETQAEHRNHFKSDWHKLNLTNDRLNKPKLSETEYNKVLEEKSNTSDSEYSSSSESDSELYKRMDNVTVEDSTKTEISSSVIKANQLKKLDRTTRNLITLPVTWYKQVNDEQLFGIYSCLLNWKQDWKESLISSVTDLTKQLWTFIMLGGGYFAMATFDNSKFDLHNIKPNLVFHKTIKKYTTRKKQGGGQGANDNKQGNAKSVGSNMRRQMEAALVEEVREVLEQNRILLNKSNKIFVRATSRNGKTLFDYEDAALKRVDPKLLNLPFTTARPTLHELNRCYMELMGPKWTKMPKIDMNSILNKKELDSPPLKLSKLPTPTEVKSDHKKKSKDLDKPAVDSKSTVKPDKQLLQTFNSIVEILKLNPNQHSDSSLDKILTTIESSLELKADINLRVPNMVGKPTLLHLASKFNYISLIEKLLDLNADPTLFTLDVDKFTAYQYTTNRNTKLAFRIYRYHHPTKFDWSNSKVADPISPQEVEANKLKEKEKTKVKKANSKAKEELKKQLLQPIIPQDHSLKLNTLNPSNRTGFGFGFGVNDKLPTVTDPSNSYNPYHQFGTSSITKDGGYKLVHKPEASTSSAGKKVLPEHREQMRLAAEARLKANSKNNTTP